MRQSFRELRCAKRLAEVPVLQRFPGSDCNAAQGQFRNLDRKAGFISEHPVDIPEKRAPARESDSAVDHVRGNLGLSLFERSTNHLNDVRQNFEPQFELPSGPQT
jgi:hypothetical protein